MIVHKPFNEEQVDNLNEFQVSNLVHPFTCGGKDCREVLIASVNGWSCPKCDYTQDWAHSFMLDGEMLKGMKENNLLSPLRKMKDEINQTTYLYFRIAEWFAHNEPGTPVPEWCELSYPLRQDNIEEMIELYEQEFGETVDGLTKVLKKEK